MRRDVAAFGTPEAINRPECGLVIWRRGRYGFLDALLRDIDLFRVQPVVVSTVLHGIEDMLAEHFTTAGYPLPLALDVAALARRFGEVMGCECVNLRLALIADDGRCRFEAGSTTVRMIVCYLGGPIDWCPIDEPDTLYTAQPGDVVLVKGLSLHDPPRIVHTPRGGAEGWTRRLLLVIDVLPN